jgi:transcription elongation factor Elf1
MMRKNEASVVTLQSTAPRPKKIGSRKRKRRKSIPVRSRYFPKIANCSFRFSTSLVSVSDTKIRSTNATRKKDTRNCKIGADALPKIAPETKIVENEEDQTLVYSLFTQNTSNASVDVNGVTSNYFLRSPSSAHGSVRSLGPLVYTWIGGSNCDDIRSNCLRQISSSDRNGKPCDACFKILIEDAFRHFRDCPVFRQELDAYNMNAEHNAGYYSAHVGGTHHQTTTCVELVGRWAEERALRHICTTQCFLRVFAPSREWMILRKNLKNLTPIGEILNDWTCRLVHETKTNEDEILGTHPALPTCRSYCNDVEKVKQDPKARYPTSEKLCRGHLPRTLFVSVKTGEVRENRAFLSLWQTCSIVL